MAKAVNPITNLTEKQEAYCQQYVICANQSTAYRIAYDAESSNVHTVAVEACKLHQNPDITLRIQQIRQEAYERNKLTIDEIVNTLATVVRFDIAELYDDNGKLLPLKQIPLHARQMISELITDELHEYVDGEKVIVGNTRKIKTYSKLDAIEKAMKHLGGYEKDNSQKPNTNVVVNLGQGIKPDLNAE